MTWVRASTPEEWTRRAEAGGADHVLADCGSLASHELRLRALVRLPLNPGDEVIDLGCGTARLADMLPDGVSYRGLDWAEGIVAEAQARRPGVNVRVGSEDDLSPADWIVASGLFNYADGWSRDRTAAALRRMWSLSKRGIAVTVLRTPADGRLHYSEAELLGHLEGCDWDQLSLDRSYLPNDVCLRAWRGCPRG